jgi:predicted nucleic acid-binding protein
VLDANVYISAAIRPEGPPGQIILGKRAQHEVTVLLQ